MKDIFIDAQIANKFASPPNDCYKRLIRWLLTRDVNSPENDAILMISDKLINEYKGGNIGLNGGTSIGAIVNLLIRQNRYTKIETPDLKNFINRDITKAIKRGLQSNQKDWWHFPLVFKSQRKLAIVEDGNFQIDLLNFPRYSRGVRVYATPDCDYLN